MTVRAPFTAEQVASLNGFQASGVFHEFTCGNDECPGTDGRKAVLVAAEDGWHCPACTYTQDWAHNTMADGTWRDVQRPGIIVDGAPVIGKWSIGQVSMPREEIISRLVAKFGPHMAPVPRNTGNPRWDKGRFDYEPDGNDAEAAAMLVFRDTDGHNSLRPLTYGEIADALCDP